MKSAAIGGVPILRARLVIPWTGVWILDADLDLGSSQSLPSGSVTPNIGDTTLTGTIDARMTGRFGEKAAARVVAGAGTAWATTLAPRHWHNDAGVSSATVVGSTAGELGETATDANPVTYASDYVRSAGAASRVLAGRDWYIDANGITQIAQWPSATPASDVQVLEYDPLLRKLELASSTSIVWPGTVFTDPKFGTVTVRDVELEFTAETFRMTAWCVSAPSTRFQADLRAMVKEYSGVDWTKLWHYRVQSVESDGRLTLTATDATPFMPSVTLPLSVWTGVAGYTADVVPGTECLVEFLEGDPSQPIVRGFASPALASTMRVALAPLVDQAFENIIAALNDHVHLGVQPGTGKSGAATGNLNPTAWPIPSQETTQAQVARAQ